jgi:hypothetical protein
MPSAACLPMLGYPVRVAVEGHGFRGVPEKVLYEFWVGAAPQKEGSAGVPEIVPADRGEARVLEERLEVAVDDVLCVERSTLAGREHEAVILPF